MNYVKHPVMNGLISITGASTGLASRLSVSAFAPALTALGAEGVLSLSAQSTTDRVLDLATELAIYAAALFVISIVSLSLWSTLTSPRTAIGRLLTSFRIDHLYMDVGLFWNQRAGNAGKAFLRTLSPRRAVIVANNVPANMPPASGQQAEISLPGFAAPLAGRIVRATPVSDLAGTFTVEIAFDQMGSETKADLISFISDLRRPLRA
jgi:hypothetical protein